MKLPLPFIQLPLTFDAPALAREIDALGESVWMPHPQGFPGNSMLPLIAVDGDAANESFGGEMRPTPPALAVSVVSGHITGKTDTLPLRVDKLYNEYNAAAAFAVASLLALLALGTLVLKTYLEWKQHAQLADAQSAAADADATPSPPRA